MNENALIAGQHTLELAVGKHPNGELIIERVLVSPQPEADSFVVLKSPVFVRGVARGDVIKRLGKSKGAFEVLQHSGNLNVRVYTKANNDLVEQALTSALEKLGGDLDVHEPRVLVYSIHVSCGFTAIETILNEVIVDNGQAQWLYGNVYDPLDGEPLNWWQPILDQV